MASEIRPIIELHTKRAVPPKLTYDNVRLGHTIAIPVETLTACALWVALTLLTITVLNHIALSIAQQSSRVYELSIRLCHGASPRILALQIVIESSLLALIATLIAVLLLPLSLQIFGALLGRELSLSFLFSTEQLLLIPALAVSFGLVIGAYPSLKCLNHRSSDNHTATKRRLIRMLMAFQFAFTCSLTITAYALLAQFNSIENHDYGF